jgi:hypothetical protein
MALFGRTSKGGVNSLVTADTLNRLAELGRRRYGGTVDVFDPWPTKYQREIQALSAGAQQRCLEALLSAARSTGGWAIYGAEEIVDGTFGSPGNGNRDRDAIFEASIDFQHDIGVWWQSLSPMEQVSWQERHPGEHWQEQREPPSPEAAQITPLAVGEERAITRISQADDARGFFVAHRAQGRYVLELDYPDDHGDRLRDPRDEAGGLYDLYSKVGQGMLLPGVWADSEFEAFLKYPMPRI